MHPNQAIAEGGIPPVKKQDDTAKQAAKSDEAAGYQLAQSVIAEQQAQRGIWLKYAAKLIPLTVAARVSFMGALASHIKDVKAHAKAAEERNDPEASAYQKAAASAVQQLSNIRTVARALNAGFIIPVKTDGTGHPIHNAQGDLIPVNPFDWTLANARLYLETHAADGKAKKGRPAKPFLDKLKKFMEDNAQTAEEVKAAKEFIDTYAALKGAA